MTDATKAGALRGEVLPDNDKYVAAPRSGDLPNGAKARRGGKSNGLSEQTQVRLGNHLRTLYDSVLHQPVPDRFRDLIDRLDSEEQKSP